MRFNKNRIYLLNNIIIKSLRKAAMLLPLLLTGLAAHALQASTAHTVFYKKDKNGAYAANVVISWKAQASSVHFSRNSDNKIEASIIVALRLSNDTGIVREESFIVKTPPKLSNEEAESQNVSDQYEYPLPAGHYEVEMVLMQDYFRSELYEYKDTFTVSPEKTGQAFLSELQLVDTFFSAAQKTVYSRNGVVDIPAVSNYYDEHAGQLRFYTEVYHPAQRNGMLIVNSYISSKRFSPPVYGLDHKDTLSDNQTYLRGAFRLAVLKSGNYYLNTVLTDSLSNILDKQSTFIQRYNPNPEEPPQDTTKGGGAGMASGKKDKNGNEDMNILDLTKTFVGKYNMGQIRAILKMIEIVADPSERASIEGFLRKPDELYSKYFIYNFWEKRDKRSPETAWKAFVDKVKETNRLFSAGSLHGYETDRGRIYIKYGKPDDRIMVPNEQGSMPYELWQYYAMQNAGYVVFLFYKSGKSIANYELLHSTMIGETRNMNWRSFLYSNSMTGTGAVNKDSQAEQYIGNK